MKTNDYLLVTGTAAYSYLFYDENAGINFFLFSLVFIAILWARNKQLLTHKKWLWAASMALLSGLCVFIHSSALSIIANCVSLLLLSAFSFNIKTSAFFSFLFSLFSIVSSFVYVVIDGVERNSKKNAKTTETKKGYRFIATIIVLVLCILFFNMYKSANPLFAENTKWINFDFISIGWVAFTLAGFLLVYGLFYHKPIPVIEEWENGLPVNNGENVTENVKRYETERFAGVLLFVFLNLMLLILNIGDVSSIWFNGTLPKGVSHSDFVHNGVGIIILSIIIATSVFMYLYRENYAKIKFSGILKTLILIWVVQNLVMLFSTACRNQIYIESFNLTYKRIGVYVWLALAVIGLLIAAVKIRKERSNWYLVRSNFALWFTVLVLSSTVNWDLLITRYNLKNQPLANVDFYYLFSLSDTNIPELLAVTKDKDFKLIRNNLKNFTSYYDDRHSMDYEELLGLKVKHYLKHYNNHWQSFDLRDVRITNALINK